MKPIKLIMQGFGSYGSKPQTIDFTEPSQNIFLIAGDTGAGKSTIFDAIVFALYGESSSSAKSKKGEELQSQFSGYDVVPFVELAFSEREGGEERIYKVRRTPSHTRFKERGSGTTKGDPEVCLTLPDGEVLDRPISYVDEIIERIVKLDKSQFKKVAMLAQGEFLAMLSASSKEKKQIFRGIFDTGIYVSIADALIGRRSAFKQRMDARHNLFAASVAQVSVVPGYDQASSLQAVIDGISSSDALDSVYAEELIEELSKLNGSMQAEIGQLEAEQARVSEAYKSALEALQKGKALVRSFDQLEKAEADLARCQREEADMTEKSEFAERIDAAYDIAGANTLYMQASESLKRDSAKLEQLNEALAPAESEAEKAHALLESAQVEAKEASEHANALDAAASRAIEAMRSLGVAQKDVAEKQETFAGARAEYERARDAYESANAAFLDSQAGYIARELEEGKPCPVCGSTDHPSPHKPAASEGSVTADVIESLKAEYDRANEAQVMASADAGHAFEGAASAQDGLRSAVSALEVDFAEEAAGLLACLVPLCEASGASLEVDRLRSALKQASASASKITSDSRDVASAAASALQEAQQRASDAKTDLEVTLQSIKSIMDSLPETKAREKEAKSQLESILSEKGAVGSDWERTVKEHSKAEISQLREAIDAFNRLRAMSQGAKEAAIEAIGDAERPDIDKLANAADAAKMQMDDGYKKIADLSASYETNVRALAGIVSSFEEWKAASREFETADELYKRLSGTKSGERMDLETFVQRYYFRQILHDANRRLREMTNNEYEFRMIDQKAAGSGSNKGLDLMVYSATNDAVRDIKTLSGGESFMAALSFALGLSDQIMAKKSAVNLDIMFIDEGFGSLDDNARKLAVDTLRSMTGDGRMIGIISHVAELKQVIDDQLIVTKNSNGSHARWYMN